uniref:Ceramide glucosyltransferase n=1 Tax=Biomphalaria glabrata TaxID=6526 RepID=A0A2C9KL78_BIOGL
MLEMGDVVPGVSIIKPLMGVDPLLEYNLESHFKLAYPKFELLFCFHDDQDAAISLVNKLHERYHHVDVKLFIGGAKDIVNPMVQNMAPAYNAVQYEFVWISSSRIEVHDYVGIEGVIALTALLLDPPVHRMMTFDSSKILKDPSQPWLLSHTKPRPLWMISMSRTVGRPWDKVDVGDSAGFTYSQHKL